jgi:peptidyl-tRNA hydrolase
MEHKEERNNPNPNPNPPPYHCPHCGSPKDPWFDRSLDHKGDMAFRCEDCGRDVDEAPQPPPSATTNPKGMDTAKGEEGGPNEDHIKQVIVMRSDLKIKHIGKFVAQGAHASIAFLTNAIRENRPVSEDANKWINGIFTKVALRIDGETPLRELAKKARGEGLEVYEIVDRGLTEFNQQPTLTCIAIGPNKSRDIDKITRHLKLL